MSSISQSENLFWSQFVDVAYWMYSNDPSNVNPPQPPNSTTDQFGPGQFPLGWTLYRNIQITTDFAGYKETTFQGFVAINPTLMQIATIFHGTVNKEQWWDDFKMELTPFTNVPGSGKVSLGFLEMFQSIQYVEPATGAVTSQKDFDVTNGMSSITLTYAGHSLGGPLAALCGVSDAAQGGKFPFNLWTFATPHIGDQTFANKALGLLSTVVRTYNKPDLVPDVPPSFLGYVHFGIPVEVNSQNYPTQVADNIGCWHSHLVYTWLVNLLAQGNSNWGLDTCVAKS